MDVRLLPEFFLFFFFFFSLYVFLRHPSNDISGKYVENADFFTVTCYLYERGVALFEGVIEWRFLEVYFT